MLPCGRKPRHSSLHINLLTSCRESKVSRFNQMMCSHQMLAGPHADKRTARKPTRSPQRLSGGALMTSTSLTSMRMRIKVELNSNCNILKYMFIEELCYAPKTLWTVSYTVPFVNAAMETKCVDNVYVFNGRYTRTGPLGFLNLKKKEWWLLSLLIHCL